MPCDYRDYHPDWKSISRQIKEQAGWHCEFCNIIQYAELPRGGRVVLTVAHLCHDPACYDPTHMRALCQRCHNRYDREHRNRNAAETRRRKKREAGQTMLGVG